MNIQQLLERYNLSSRKTLYNRLNALNIKLSKDSNNKSFATDEQIKMLDELENHLKSGGVLRNFTPVTSATVHLSVHDESEKEINLATRAEERLREFKTLMLEGYQEVGKAIAKELKPHHSRYESLLFYCENKILLTSSEIRELIGIKPKRIEFIRGSFKFIKKGKIGNQGAWEVVKII